MLKGIPNILTPELLKVLAEMGHTDELTIGDGNFPGHSFGTQVIRLDGHGVPEILDAILQVMPLDTYPDSTGKMVPPCTLMAVEPGDDAKTPNSGIHIKKSLRNTMTVEMPASKKSTNGTSMTKQEQNPVLLS